MAIRGSACVSRVAVSGRAETEFINGHSCSLSQTQSKSSRIPDGFASTRRRVRYPRTWLAIETAAACSSAKLEQARFLARCGRSNHSVSALTNLCRLTQNLPSFDSARIRRRDRCSQRFLSAMQPDNGNRRNRFPFADNFGTAPASILFHGSD